MDDLIRDELYKYSARIPGWEIIDDKKLEREFKFNNFKEAMAFVNKVAAEAEIENHHPDIYIHGWNKVKLTLSTHSVSGLTKKDFVMAAKVNSLNQ